MQPHALREAVRSKPVRVGRYELVAIVGHGGMGDVFEAIDTETGGRVALKTLGVRELAPDRLLLFKNEFRSVADLVHPNLVPIYELGCHEGLWFVTMELVQGVDLVDRLTRTLEDGTTTGPKVFPTPRTHATRAAKPSARGVGTSSEEIPLDRAPMPYCDLALFTSTIAQVLDALEYLHQHGVVHQDLKPNNLLVQEDGTVRVLDFGLAQRIGASVRLAGDDQRIGTPAYMAPELWVDGVATPESDLFALGCMMFQLLTGSVPSEDGWVRARRQPSVAELVDGVPAPLVDVCDRLLARAPEERPSIAEVRSALGVEHPVASELRAAATLVGRVRERELLGDALDRASSGACVVALVEGGSGVGKSALVRSCFTDRPLREDVVALHGRCYERESVPFKAFDGMIDAIAIRLSAYDDEAYARVLPPYFDELTKVFPVLASAREPGPSDVSGVFPMELRRRVLEALYQLFVRLAAQHALVLDIDDLQWADAESLALLEKLVQGAPSGLLLVLSQRPEECAERPDVASFLRDVRKLPKARVVSVPLGALDAHDSESLARSALASLGLGDELAAAIAAESGGIPFFLEELAQSAAALGAKGTPEIHLDHALDARARALPTQARALVEVLAVANSPIPRAVACAAAEIEGDVSGALAMLQRGRFMRSAGVRAGDRLAIYHDRMREAVLAGLGDERAVAIHLALARAHVAALGEAPSGAPLFDAVRHLGAASHRLRDGEESERAARLHLLAGRQARAAAAFPLAFQCFEAGIMMLSGDAWDREYDTCLGLHVGAAEAAYLTASWLTMDRRVAEVKAHARTVVEQLPVYAVQIDALSGRQQYAAAIDAGLEALARLGVPVPREPDEATVGEAFGRALEGLGRLGPEGLEAMPDATDPDVLGAMLIQVRLCPVAFFASQPLLALMACNLVSASVDHGLSTATPNALALFGLIMNTVGMYRDSHAWGQLAIRLIERWDDRSLEAATRHVVFDFVCPWIAPLRTIAPSSREVFEIGFRSGDFEYAGYAAHVWTYMELATGAPLGALCDEALSLGDRMRACGQLNALHIHASFEQLLVSLTGRKSDPWRLDDVGYSEDDSISKAVAVSSRGSICVHHVAIGMVRFFFGRHREASEHLEIARAYLDGAPSCWLIPYCHQFAVLAGTAVFHELSDAERDTLRPRLDESVAAMRAFAAAGEVNFAHRVTLLEAAVLGLDGPMDVAVERTREALAASERDGWLLEVSLAHDLLARSFARAGRADEARRSEADAIDAYTRWGAVGVVRHRAEA